MDDQEMTELPGIMASLDIGEAKSKEVSAVFPGEDAEEQEDEEEPSPLPLRSRLRRRSLPMANAVSKRRCSLKPKKLEATSEDEEKWLNYYLNKKVNTSTRKALETIYEEPKTNKNGSLVLIGVSRQRRVTFSDESKAKLKKRKSMIKKVLTSSKGPKCRLSMDEFLTRMQCSRSQLKESGGTSPK